MIKCKITTQILVDSRPKLPQSNGPVAQDGQTEQQDDDTCEKPFITQFPS